MDSGFLPSVDYDALEYTYLLLELQVQPNNDEIAFSLFTACRKTLCYTLVLVIAHI